MKSGSYVYNSTKKTRERIGRLLRMHANKREEIDAIYAGDIAACVGLKSVTTGDTLCDEEKPIVLESIEFPAPVISVAIEPKTKADQDKLGNALQRLAQEDPTFRVHTDPDTGQTLISGMGELHLEIIVDRMMREFGVQASVGRPQVAYRETIRKTRPGRRQVHPADRRPRPVRPLQDRSCIRCPSSGHEDMHEMSTDELDALAKEVARLGRQMALRQRASLAVHRQDHRRVDSQGIYRPDRRRHSRSHGKRHAGRLRNGGHRRGA